jgi:alpha-D-ribose 1-methylphosphonate 5-triphosphate diphosphatase PhnM
MEDEHPTAIQAAYRSRKLSSRLLFGAPIVHLGGAAYRWSRIKICDLIAAERQDACLCPAIEIRKSISLDIDCEHMG